MVGLGLWPLRILWATLPVTSGAAFGAALDSTSTSFRTTCTVGLWTIWALTLVASLVPRPVTLTLVRIVAPAAVLAALWAASDGEADIAVAATALIATALVAIVALLPFTGDVFVDGSSYGSERRMALRAPGPLLLGPIELAWVVVVVGASAGPLLLAVEVWVGGVVALVIGLPAAALCARALHGLARRWLVFVPNGLVVHDATAVTDPVLLPRSAIVRVGPALADTDALDLTQGAVGLALQIDLDEPVRLARASRDGRNELEDVSSLLVTPSRPAGLLEEAEQRRLPVA